jgi:hypothetical protein
MAIAEYDIARCLEPLDSPVMKDFVDSVETVFALAESSTGFIWRCNGDENNAESFLIGDDPLMVENLSVWASVSDLHNFLYRTNHVNYLKRGREWFSPLSVTKVALWYVEPGHQPSIEEGRERLQYLQKHGDSDTVFGLKSRSYFESDNV